MKIGFLLVICLATFLPFGAIAQEAETYRIDTRIDPPLGPDSAQLHELGRQSSARMSVVYADQITGDLSSGKEVEALRETATRGESRPILGGGGVWIAIALVVLALVVWLRFGGAGNLLAARPTDDRAPEIMKAPDAWAISTADMAHGPEALIGRLLALPDRGQALAGLLRHSLLVASQETQIRLARADTERQAFDRLPAAWRQHSGLKSLLTGAELAHYGGREVSDTALAELAQIARAILIPGFAPTATTRAGETGHA